MAKKFYLPRGDQERKAFLNNFNFQLHNNGTKYGIKQSEIDATNADTLAYNYMLDILEVFISQKEGRTTYKNLMADGKIGSQLGPIPDLPVFPEAPPSVPAGIFKRISKIVIRIKKHSNYNESVGKSFGIIGAEKNIDIENTKVKFSLRHSNNEEIAFDFIKSVFNGVIIYGGVIVETAPSSLNTSENEVDAVMKWTEIGRVFYSPYIDRRLNATNKPETRHYKMHYIIKDEAVGKDSDIISVIANVQKRD